MVMEQTYYLLKEQLCQWLTNLPWQTHSISLLLDGVNVNNLLHRFYTQNNTSTFEVLYMQTPFAQLYDISPCLVKLDNANNPHLQAYLDNLNNEWGYLLISNQSWQQQIDHLRKLILVELPADNEQTILKIADPMVAKALFGLAEEQQDTQFFGPFNQIYTTDIIDGELNSYQRLDKAIIPLAQPYKLTQEQNLALDKVEEKRNNYQLYQHMQQHFPHFLAHYPEPVKKQAIYQIIQEANSKGYKTPMEQTYYLNIQGYLGDEALQNYPEINSLVNQSTLEKIREAAKLAEELAITLSV